MSFVRAHHSSLAIILTRTKICKGRQSNEIVIGVPNFSHVKKSLFVRKKKDYAVVLAHIETSKFMAVWLDFLYLYYGQFVINLLALLILTSHFKKASSVCVFSPSMLSILLPLVNHVTRYKSFFLHFFIQRNINT